MIYRWINAASFVHTKLPREIFCFKVRWVDGWYTLVSTGFGRFVCDFMGNGSTMAWYPCQYKFICLPEMVDSG